MGERMASTDGAPRRRRRRALFAGGLLGASALAVVGANAVQVQRLRRASRELEGELDHVASVGEGVGPALRLTVLGDSAARGFGLGDPREAFPFLTAARLSTAVGRRIDVSSLATDGHTTADVLAEQVPRLSALRPDVVVVSVGVNDAVKGVGIRDVEAGTEALLTRVRGRVPGAVVVLVSCPDLGAAPGFPAPLNRIVSWRCRRVARAQERAAAAAGVGVAVLDRPTADAFGPDGFHPGPVGHRGMAAAAVEALVQAAEEEQVWISG